MNDGPRNTDRDLVIAGARAGALSPEERAELELLADLLADPLTWAEPDAGLEDAVVRAVAGAAPVGVAPSRRAAATPVVPFWRRRIVGAVAAAAAAVAVLLGALSITGGTNPDFSGRLTATALAPRASATAEITHNRAGFRIDLNAHGLPALQAKAYYAAWLKDRSGALVAIGTFSSSDGHITLWSGVSPKEFPIMSVTVEPKNDDERSSGRVVLLGALHHG